MAEGSRIGFQGNAPLDGETNIVQTVAGLASDVLTITGAAGQTGDFLVCQNSAGTEYFALTSSGVFVASSISNVGAETVGGTLTVTGVTSLNNTVAIAKSALFVSSVGFFSKAPVAQPASSTACPAVEGAYGWNSSANFVAAVLLIHQCRRALQNLGLMSAD